MSKVLLVEDEESLSVVMKFNLENKGYEVELATSGEDALRSIEAGGIDLVLLDVNLPGELDGFEVARRMRREQDHTPVIIISAQGRPEDRITGLDAGADDYLSKPFELDELLARVRGHLRRQVWSRKPGGGDSGASPSVGKNRPPLEFGDPERRVDFRTFQAIDKNGQEIQLSFKESQMMRLFAENEGEVIPRARFLEEVWGEPPTLETRTIDNHVMRLRRYFEVDPKKPKHILSVRGVGYRFVR